MKKTTAFLYLSILIFAIGICLSTAGLYVPLAETSEPVVGFHFPNGNLTTYEGEHYNVGGVYSTYYSWRDIIRVWDYSPRRINESELPIDLYMVFTTAEHNGTLHRVRLIDLLEFKHFFISAYLKHFFISAYDGEINVYLASPLSLSELEQKGYYGDWAVTLLLHHYAHGNWAILVLGMVVCSAGVLMIIVSSRKALIN